MTPFFYLPRARLRFERFYRAPFHPQGVRDIQGHGEHENEQPPFFDRVEKRKFLRNTIGIELTNGRFPTCKFSIRTSAKVFAGKEREKHVPEASS